MLIAYQRTHDKHRMHKPKTSVNLQADQDYTLFVLKEWFLDTGYGMYSGIKSENDEQCNHNEGNIKY